jgi:hypothetical protein
MRGALEATKDPAMHHAFKNRYINIIALWVVISAAAILTENTPLLIITFAYTGFLPFIFAITWISYSAAGKKIQETLKLFHWAVMLSISIALYGIYAKSWATSTINSIFHVDPSHFPITLSFVSLLFAPISLLYHEDIIGAVNAIYIITAMSLVYIIPIALLSSLPIKKVLKISGIFFGSIFLISFFVSMAFNLSKKVGNLTAEFALATDFNKLHLCENTWANNAESLIFLGGEHVLVYSPSRPTGSKFSKESCDFKKRF